MIKPAPNAVFNFLFWAILSQLTAPSIQPCIASDWGYEDGKQRSQSAGMSAPQDQATSQAASHIPDPIAGQAGQAKQEMGLSPLVGVRALPKSKNRMHAVSDSGAASTKAASPAAGEPSPGTNRRASSTEGRSAKPPSAFAQPEMIDIDGRIRQKKEAAETSSRKRLDRVHDLTDQWLGVFELLPDQKLSEEQRNRFRSKLFSWANSPQHASFEAVSHFWPQVAKAIRDTPEQHDNYKDLFKALFRLEKRSGVANQQEDEILDELLGPERIAVPGSPPLTEDAVEAYADMTCFIYGQTHPGKTVDALDNRTVFVATIEHKFEDTESLPEKLAIANFALKWSKFRIMYAAANDIEKEKLLHRLTGSSSESLRKDITNSALDAVLANGPWTAALNAKIAPSPAPALTPSAGPSRVPQTPQSLGPSNKQISQHVDRPLN